MSNHEMNLVSIQEAADILQALIGHAFETGTISPNIMLHGTYGVGKSAITQQLVNNLADELGKPVRLIDIRLGCYEASEVQGIPYNADDHTNILFKLEDGTPVFAKTMKHSTPGWFPEEEEDVYTILLLDEFPNAPIDVQHSAYRLLLDRSIQNGSTLPDSTAIVLAGNLPEDKTGVKPLMPAAANRIGVHLLIDSSRVAEGFTDKMIEWGWHPSVIGYLTWKKDALVGQPDGSIAVARPRTWEQVSNHMFNPRLSAPMLSACIAGAVGNSAACDFSGYREFEGQLPNWEAIREGKETYDPGPNPEDQLMFAVAIALSFEFSDIFKNVTDANRPQYEEQVDRLSVVLDSVPNEMLTVMFKMMVADSRFKNVVLFPSLRKHFTRVSSRVTRLKAIDESMNKAA